MGPFDDARNIRYQYLAINISASRLVEESKIRTESRKRISSDLDRSISKRRNQCRFPCIRESNKAHMIKTLARKLKLPIRNILVFGDYMNDLGMFKIAGRAIAVSNAIPDVKRAAHEIIGSNDNNSVIAYLESLGFA